MILTKNEETNVNFNVDASSSILSWSKKWTCKLFVVNIVKLGLITWRFYLGLTFERDLFACGSQCRFRPKAELSIRTRNFFNSDVTYLYNYLRKISGCFSVKSKRDKKFGIWSKRSYIKYVLWKNLLFNFLFIADQWLNLISLISLIPF